MGDAALQAALSLPADGRQSETALAVARGARGACSPASAIASVTELTLASGRRADIVGAGPGRHALDRRDQVERRGLPGRHEVARLS